MQQQIARNTPSLVDQTVASYGSWDTIAFLLVTHDLHQREYEAWRMGEVAWLEDAMVGSPQDVVAMLKVALSYGQSIGLIAEPISWHGWGSCANQTLRLFHNDTLNSTFQCRLSPASGRRQLDLFMDAPHIVLLNQLRQAMRNRDPQQSTLFDRAFSTIADDPVLARLDTIRVAMATTKITDPLAWFTHLNETIAPAARDAFAQQSIDIMAPIWRTAADAMAQTTFDPLQPDLHASQALLLAHDWEQCIATIAQTPHWFEHAPLHGRRIAALSAMDAHQTLRTAWMAYCWHCPDDAATALNQADLHSCGLHGAWQQFSQLEHNPSIEDFPALAAILAPSQDSPPPSAFIDEKQTKGWHHYQQVIALQQQERHHGTDITLRSALKTSRSWLLQAYMASHHA